MALIELKTYKPVCDRCGRVGSTWTNLPEDEREKAVPDGWAWTRSTANPNYPRQLDLTCDECLAGAKEVERDDIQVNLQVVNEANKRHNEDHPDKRLPTLEDDGFVANHWPGHPRP